MEMWNPDRKNALSKSRRSDALAFKHLSRDQRYFSTHQSLCLPESKAQPSAGAAPNTPLIM